MAGCVFVLAICTLLLIFVIQVNQMETVLLQINNKKAYRLLEDLEDLDIITVLNKSVGPTQKLSEKYAGKLPVEIADKLQNYVRQSREEWNNRSI